MRTLLLLLALSYSASAQTDWQTPTERSGYRTTPRYDETMAYIRRVAAAAPKQVTIEQFGETAGGYPLYSVIVSKDGVRTPQAAHQANRAVVYIQNGIHAGEIEGKDASLALLRDAVITKTQAKLLDRAVLLIIPVYNVDGHERVSKYNRINQNGPEERGWRTNAENLNLNRDYLKAQTPETRAFLALWNKWQPDFFFDNHVTDGADYQYVITYSVPHGPDQSPELREWLTKSLFPYVDTSVSRTHAIGPYVDPIDPNDLAKGLKINQSVPRFSDGYVMIRNRPGMLVEMHMLKDYKTRVTGNYELMRAVIEVINRDADALLKINRAADAGMQQIAGKEVVLKWVATGETEPLKFLGYKYNVVESDVSGDKWVQYSHEPVTMTVPMQSGMKVTKTVKAPAAYVVPAAWQKVIDVLKAHGVNMQTLPAPQTFEAEIYHCATPKWMSAPFEGRHAATFGGEGIGDTASTLPRANTEPAACVAQTEKVTFPKGSVIVPANQPAGKVAIEWLEPEAPDSALTWGFFDTIFEQKEYGESYVMEKVARDMMAKDPSLKAEFDKKVQSDPEFAKSPAARLNWFYKRSPWFQELNGRYPVARLAALPQ